MNRLQRELLLTVIAITGITVLTIHGDISIPAFIFMISALTITLILSPKQRNEFRVSDGPTTPEPPDDEDFVKVMSNKGVYEVPETTTPRPKFDLPAIKQYPLYAEGNIAKSNCQHCGFITNSTVEVVNNEDAIISCSLCGRCK